MRNRWCCCEPERWCRHAWWTRQCCHLRSSDICRFRALGTTNFGVILDGVDIPGSSTGHGKAVFGNAFDDFAPRHADDIDRRGLVGVQVYMPVIAEDITRSTDKVGLAGYRHFASDGYGLGFYRIVVNAAFGQPIYQKLVCRTGGKVVAHNHIAPVVTTASVADASGQCGQVAFGVEDIECLCRLIVDVEFAIYGCSLLGVGAVYNLGGGVICGHAAFPDTFGDKVRILGRFVYYFIVHLHRGQTAVGSEHMHPDSAIARLSTYESLGCGRDSCGN